MTPQERLALALQYQKQRDLGSALPSTPAENAARPVQEPEQSWLDKLNEAGMGFGYRKAQDLEDLAQAARHPLDTLHSLAVGVGKAMDNPSAAAQAAWQGIKQFAGEAVSSPYNLGSAVAGMTSFNPRKIAAMLESPAVREITAYHGTPHRFPATEANPLGEFDASKIGTGEGAQAYGHGIYLAQKPEVAQDYQFMLSKIDPETVTYQGKPVQHWYDMAQAEQNRAHRLNDRAAIDRANAKLAYWENVMTRRHPEDVKRVANDPDDGWKTFADYANSLDMNKFGGVGEAGSLYKADLPDEMIDRMLDWDKPLSEQPAAVREALIKNPAVAAEVKRINAQREALNAQNPRRLTHSVISKLAKKETTAESLKGQALYELLAKGGNQAETSAYFRSLGIPGIKYLDAGSRGATGTGTRNFVVFPGEEKKVKILERK